MIHNDYKKMFNTIIDNNLTQIHNLDSIEELRENMDDRTRRKLEQMYKNMRETINTNLRLTPAEVLFLGTGASLSTISIKGSLERSKKTLQWFEEVLLPAFEEIRLLEGLADDKQALVDAFYEKFSLPIDISQENKPT